MAHRAGRVNNPFTTTAATGPVSQHLEGLHSRQVTHNRLPGSGRRVQSSWLYAFNWALFSDPLLVWNACEVSEQASIGGASHRQHRQWRVTFSGSGGAKTASSGKLQAVDGVPSIIRHIWGLPLARSEGFDDAAPPDATLYRSSSSGWQPSQAVLMPSAGGSASASDSLTRQGGLRGTPASTAPATSSTTIINNNNNYNP